MHSSRMRTVPNSSRLLGGVCSGGCLLWGVCSRGGGGVPVPGEVPGPSGVPGLVQGVLGPGGCLVPGGVPGKNITFATSLRTVKMKINKHKKTSTLLPFFTFEDISTFVGLLEYLYALLLVYNRFLRFHH